jgi:hypothetical protein
MTVASQVECPDFGSKNPRSRLSNDRYLHYGVDVFTLIYADKPWIVSILPHFGVKGELNILRHVSICGSMGSYFKSTRISLFSKNLINIIFTLK